MTPDEVVDNLKLFINKLDNPSPGGTTLQIPKQSIQSAITLIQDYQKLRERVSVECLEKFLYKFNDDNRKELFVTCSRTTTRYPIQYKKDIKYLAQAILTYLQQPTEH